MCPYCNYPGLLMNIYFNEIIGDDFEEYIKNHKPKIDIRPEWRTKDPVEFFRAAYPEYFDYKDYNL